MRHFRGDSTLLPTTMSILNVAIIGVGLVGSELISQIAQPQLASKFRLVYVSNSKRALQGNDILLASWKEALEASSQSPALDTLPEFLRRQAQSSGHPVVLVDNTSSDLVAARYPQFLDAGIHVVTPNKKAYSSDLALYDQIAASSAATGAKFLNEATVGAGLPIISTLKDLVATGDKVRRFRGTIMYVTHNCCSRSSRSKGSCPEPSVISSTNIRRQRAAISHFRP